MASRAPPLNSVKYDVFHTSLASNASVCTRHELGKAYHSFQYRSASRTNVRSFHPVNDDKKVRLVLHTAELRYSGYVANDSKETTCIGITLSLDVSWTEVWLNHWLQIKTAVAKLFSVSINIFDCFVLTIIGGSRPCAVFSCSCHRIELRSKNVGFIGDLYTFCLWIYVPDVPEFTFVELEHRWRGICCTGDTHIVIVK